jgi:hypothetical protein
MPILFRSSPEVVSRFSINPSNRDNQNSDQDTNPEIYLARMTFN